MVVMDLLEPGRIIEIIEKFKISNKYKNMITGEKYFKSKTDILDREFYYFPNGVKQLDSYRANNLIVDNFFRMLVEQKVSYCLAKDIVISGYNPSFDVNEFSDIVAEESSIKGIGWGHVYVDKVGALLVAYIPSEQFIPLYDGTIEKNIVQGIRFYEVNENQIIEYWTETEQIVYKVDKDKKLIEINKNENMFGKVPFVPLYNNRFEMTDLENIKELIDTFDKTISDFANNFEDFQDVYYKIKNYVASTNTDEDISVIIESLKRHKIVPVDENGDFEAVQLEVPYSARETYLKMVRQLIFLFGQGVDTDELAGGSLTNVVIQARFSNLEQKCNKFIKQIKRFIQECIWFDIKYKNKNGNPDTKIENLDIVFNTSLLINETETINNLSTCTVNEKTMSQQTAVANNPLVDNGDKEMKLIEEEEAAYDNEVTNTFEPPESNEGDEIDT